MAAVVLAGSGLSASDPVAADGRSRLRVTFDRAEFLATQPITSTETFESLDEQAFPEDLIRPVVSSVRYRSLDTAAPSWGTQIEEWDGVASKALLRRFPNGYGHLDLALGFRDGGSVKAFGFWLHAFATLNSMALRVTEVDGRTTVISLGTVVQRTYIGLSSRKGISSVVIFQRPAQVGGAESNFSLDDVSRTHITPRP